MSNLYLRTNYAPERQKGYLTIGKLYPVQKIIDQGSTGYLCAITTDIGVKFIPCTSKCAHLDGKPWEVLQGIAREELLSLISKQKGFFSVLFIKKDGSLRRMTCMFNVKKHLVHNGEKPPTVDTDKYYVVYSVKDKGYRAVNKSTIKEARIRGINYLVEGE